MIRGEESKSAVVFKNEGEGKVFIPEQYAQYGSRSMYDDDFQDRK